MIDTNKELPIPADLPHTGKMADPGAVQDFWTQVVRSADERGRLEKIPTVKGVSPRGRDIARKQNGVLTRRSFAGVSDAYRAGYERIFRRGRPDDGQHPAA